MIAEKEVCEKELVKTKYKVECHRHKNEKTLQNFEEHERVE